MNDGEEADVAALREDIRHTRTELGETVQALAAKADVKARAKESVHQTAEQVKESAQHAAGRAMESAQHAAERIKESAQHAAERAAVTTGHAVERARDSLHETGERARRRPGPWLVLAGALVVLAVALAARRRRR